MGRLYALHILLLPAVMLLLIALHLVFVVMHKHTQYPGPGRSNANVVGYPILPGYAAKAGGFLFIVFSVVSSPLLWESIRSGDTAPTTPRRC